MKKAMRIVIHTGYTLLVVCVLGIALLFLGTRAEFLPYQIKIVQSGSMEPAIRTGGVVIIAPTEGYQIGDVITFGQDTMQSIPTTHRIIGFENVDSRLAYITKGDANEEADPAPIRATDVIGKVLIDVPYLGYVLEFARTPWGYALLVGIPALLIVLDEFANIMWEFHKYRRERRKKLLAQQLAGLHPITTDRDTSSEQVRIVPRRIARHDVVPSARRQRQLSGDLDLRVLKPYRRA